MSSYMFLRNRSLRTVQCVLKPSLQTFWLLWKWWMGLWCSLFCNKIVWWIVCLFKVRFISWSLLLLWSALYKQVSGERRAEHLAHAKWEMWSPKTSTLNCSFFHFYKFVLLSDFGCIFANTMWLCRVRRNGMKQIWLWVTFMYILSILSGKWDWPEFRVRAIWILLLPEIAACWWAKYSLPSQGPSHQWTWEGLTPKLSL